MYKQIMDEFKNIVWPKREQVKSDLFIVSVMAAFLMIIVIFMDNGTQYIFEQIASRF